MRNCELTLPLHLKICYIYDLSNYAGVAQLVEQLICNQPVASSSLVTSLS